MQPTYKMPSLTMTDAFMECIALLRWGAEGCNLKYSGAELVEKMRNYYLVDFKLPIDPGSKRWTGNLNTVLY